MQSILQYRLLREDVKRDLANQKAFKLAKIQGNSPLSSSIRDVSPSSGHETAPQNNNAASVSTLVTHEEFVLPGITISRPDGKEGAPMYIVGWQDGDRQAPKNWSRTKKWLATVNVCLIAIAMAIPSSIDAPVAEQFADRFKVSSVAGSMTTAMFLIGFGVGSLFAGPFSDTLGRNIVYMGSMILFMIFLMAKALTPNYGAALAFRFLAGFFGSTPLTCAGGSVADIWTPLETVFALPTYTMVSYMGPISGPIIGAYIPLIGFRWADWICLIFSGAIMTLMFFTQPETYSPLLLEWRAHHLRQLTGNSRFMVAGSDTRPSLPKRLLLNVYRPFQMTYTEPIIMVFSLYLSIIYIILFTFLNGYPYIFQRVYGISLSLTFILWAGILVGDCIGICLIPIVYRWTKASLRHAEARGEDMKPEVCLYFAMMGGSIFLPISLFWMGWTCYDWISIASPIIASVFFGYGLITVFTTTYLYIIFVYHTNAAAALTFMTFSRYVISGGITPVSIPMYQNLGPHFALTILACISAAMAPVPFVLYKYGHKIRGMSKNVQARN